MKSFKPTSAARRFYNVSDFKELTEDAEIRQIPVAVLSADAMPGQVKRLKAAGAIAYLTKPLDVGQVLSLLDELLTRQG